MATDTPLPLSGYRVLDFGWVIAGPLLGRILADMGAEVLKVESRRRLDEMRRSPANLTGDLERDPVFHDVNRNKLSVVVDFALPQGQWLIRELVKHCDAVAENFAPRVLRQHNLHYEALREIKPDLVMISMSAAGQDGPLRDIVTYGPSLSAIAGLDAMVGYEGERVLGSQGYYADMTCAAHGAFALLAALWHRERTGEGQYIDLSQWETTTGCIAEALFAFQFTGRVPGPLGNGDLAMAPHGNYPCRETDTWLAIAVGDEDEWRGFCRALGDPAWSSAPAFADRFRRLKHSGALDEHVASWTCTQQAYDAARLLQAHGVAAAPNLHVGERYFDPHFEARELYVEVEHPCTGPDILNNVPWKLAQTPARIVRPAPLLGQHTEDVLRGLLGLRDAQIAALRAEGVI